jgi:branched-subunit amino acid ABC-type transport system permease component
MIVLNKVLSDTATGHQIQCVSLAVMIVLNKVLSDTATGHQIQCVSLAVMIVLNKVLSDTATGHQIQCFSLAVMIVLNIVLSDTATGHQIRSILLALSELQVQYRIPNSHYICIKSVSVIGTDRSQRGTMWLTASLEWPNAAFLKLFSSGDHFY